MGNPEPGVANPFLPPPDDGDEASDNEYEVRQMNNRDDVGERIHMGPVDQYYETGRLSGSRRPPGTFRRPSNGRQSPKLYLPNITTFESVIASNWLSLSPLV